MGELNEARLLAVRSLLQRAPDFAVQSLSSLLASDQSNDRSLALVRELVSAEAGDRRFRSLAFEPLAVLCKPATTIAHLTFPPATPTLLWQAVKAYQPSFDARLATEPKAGRRETLKLMDDICAAAAEGLATRATPDFAALADRLDASPNGCAQVVALLSITPDLRDALAKAPTWLGSAGPAHSAAVRIAFRTVSEKSPDAGALFMEVLFAAIEQPAFILKLVSMIMDRPSDRFLAASELSSLGERLLDAIDSHIGVIQAFDPRRGLEGGVAAAAAADAATLIILELETNVAMPREGVWGARVVRQRRALAVAMETRLQEIEAAMAAALPVKTLRVHGKKLRGPPNLTKLPDPPATDKLLGLAALLSGCSTAAQVNGFSALRAKLIETQDQALQTYVQDVLDLTHGGQAPVDIARAYLDVAAEVVGLIRDPKAAELVRRRAVAATSGAALAGAA
jgi:hypothetical protein